MYWETKKLYDQILDIMILQMNLLTEVCAPKLSRVSFTQGERNAGQQKELY